MTDGEVRAVRYELTDRKQVHDFLKTVRSPRDSQRLITQWEWKYDANPYNPEPRPYIVLLKEDARIAGLMADLPVHVWAGGRVSRWVCACDLSVHPDYRGRGLSRTIISEHLAHQPLTPPG